MIKVIVDGEELEVDGRIEAAIRYLIERAKQVEVMQKGSVELHFAGKGFRPSIHDMGDVIDIAK